jgi:hypothetical protein
MPKQRMSEVNGGVIDDADQLSITPWKTIATTLGVVGATGVVAAAIRLGSNFTYMQRFMRAERPDVQPASPLHTLDRFGNDG